MSFDYDIVNSLQLLSALQMDGFHTRRPALRRLQRQAGFVPDPAKGSRTADGESSRINCSAHSAEKPAE